MKQVGIICFLAIVSLVSAGDEYYRGSPKKVVYVEKESPRYEVIRREPEYKKTVYEYREPENKKVIVNVLKQEEKKYVAYEPKKDVVVKVKRF